MRNEAWRDLAALQAGVIARAQLLALGLSPAQARVRIDTHRWQRLLPGIYATHTGPIEPIARVWAAVLSCGPGAVASHSTALWLAGALDQLLDRVDVTVPISRRVRPKTGVRVHRSSRLSDVSLRTTPPRVRLEEAVLDVADFSDDPTTVVDLLLRVTQRRLTTAERLRGALVRRSRHRWRQLIGDILGDVDVGVASPLEHRYMRDVETAHGLPRGIRNAAEGGGTEPRRYHDVRYEPWALLVELDGREAHPAERAFRDRDRDNRAAISGDSVLRYGWRDVVGDPCGVAGQVGTVLHRAGWGGAPRRCGPSCSLQLRHSA